MAQWYLSRERTPPSGSSSRKLQTRWNDLIGWVSYVSLGVIQTGL
jgi:hypothetical protein